MQTQVKTKSCSPQLDILVEVASGLWLLYFFSSIAAIGTILALGLVVPLYAMARFVPSVSEAADRTMCRGIRFLMSMQPWFFAEIELSFQERPRGCLLVSNHRSHLDAFILLSRVPGIRILAKKSLFHVPFLGMMMRLSGQIPAESGNPRSYLDALNVVKERLSRGEVVHVFPELTRCPYGFDGVQPFSLAPFRAAMQGGFPVIPIVFQGTDEVWPKAARGLRYRKPIRVRALEAIHPGTFATSEEFMRETHRRIQQTMAAV
jgi:1-acyl-sn-glycerol-3-phosphate acyltransferase